MVSFYGKGSKRWRVHACKLDDEGREGYRHDNQVTLNIHETEDLKIRPGSWSMNAIQTSLELQTQWTPPPEDDADDVIHYIYPTLLLS